MAKRFIDTDFFKDPFVRSLNSTHKLLYVFMMTNCDHAGCWVPDFEVAAIYTGLKLDEKDILTVFESKIFICKDRWFFPEFIEFQYGNLNPENRAHSSVIKILKEQGIDYKVKPLANPLHSPLLGCKDKDMDMDKDLFKDMDMDKGMELKNSLISSFEDKKNRMMKKQKKICLKPTMFLYIISMKMAKLSGSQPITHTVKISRRMNMNKLEN